MGSRSRSRSDSSGSDHDSPRIDQFGRFIPKRKKTRSRSRSRHRIRSRSRDRSRRHSKSRRSRSRSRGRSSIHSRSSSHRRSRSHSSRSPSRPVRPIIVFNRRSRSRSRGRSSSQRRRIPRRHFRRDSHDRLKSCSPPEKSPSRSPEPSKPTSETNLNVPELQKSRVFIGNLPFDKITKDEIEEMFGKYGKILGLSIHERGFGFVQYSKEEEGLEAVANENGGLLKGQKLLVKMAFDGKRGVGKPPPPPRRSPPPSSYDRGYPMGGAGHGPAPPRPGAPDSSDRESYPPSKGGPDSARFPDRARERSPLRADPYSDRFRDPYRDPALPPPPPRRDDPYYADPYRRPPPPDDPYYDRYRDDPYRYRRDPYADPYREPYYRDYPPYDTPARKPQPVDCEIIILSGTLTGFAEFLERKLKVLNLQVAIVVIPEDRTIPQVIEDASKRSVLFAVVINSQNEVHQSLTLNILHGTPQEHRNMPVEDAVTLIGRSFEQYMQTSIEKSAGKLAPAAATGVSAPPIPERATPAPFVPPDADISYLLNLLADNRQLTIEEIEKVITYLRQRRDKLLEADGRRPPLDDGRVGYGGAGDRKDEAASLNQQQQELQAKILSILNGPGEDGPHAAPEKRLPPRVGGPMGNGAHQQQGGQGMSSLINFDSPSVQKALDNLIQSGPNLLKNISSPQGGATMTQQAALMSRHGGEPMRRDLSSQHSMMMRDQGYGGLGTGAVGHSGVSPAGGAQPRPLYSSAGMSAPVGVPRPSVQQNSRRPY